MHSLTRFFSLVVCCSSAAVAQTVPPDLMLTDFCPSCPNFTTPLGIQQAGTSGLYFVHEQGGALKAANTKTNTVSTIVNFNNGSGTPPPGGFSSGGERGLLGVAFHPLFDSNGFVYLSYNDGDGDTMLARYTLSAANPPQINLGSRLEILAVDQDFSNHNGGHIAFGPDGYLYVGLGDGGDSNDPCQRAQTLTPAEIVNSGSGCPADGSFGGNPNSRALLGSLLRIDVDATTPVGANQLCAANSDGSANYAIPADNPFAGNAGVANACDEILHYGIRNPWRFSFDRETGDLLIGDVGQGAREEISFKAFGAISATNFGWDCREGFIAASGSCRAGDTLVDPVMDYPRNAGTSTTGGYVYRGPISPLRGVYFFADFNSRRVWTATQTAPGVFGPQPTNTN
ncbi:MAG: PQQ-dependent sugar dehydrogenase, partial [Xanthomonadales bacterium]|nr:PQQ-dependent sugar dehydrogenase [Xanthomonadales bacterium]